MNARKITTLSLIAMLAASTLPVGAVAQAAEADQIIELKCKSYVSPAAPLPQGKPYPSEYSIELRGGMWRITSQALSTQGTWAEEPQKTGAELRILSHIDFKWKNGTKAASFNYIGTMQNMLGTHIVAEIGHYDAPPLSYFCVIRT